MEFFVKIENCQKCGKEGGVCWNFDRCLKVFSFFIWKASLINNL